MVLLIYFSDNTVRQIVILSLILAAGIFVAAMIMTICRVWKDIRVKPQNVSVYRTIKSKLVPLYVL